MKITLRNLKGGSTHLDVNEKTSILELKKLAEKDLKIPASQQTIVLLGKSLQEDKCIGDYPQVKEGCKLYVAVKVPESMEAVLTKFLRKHYNEEQCKLITDEFVRNIHSKVESLSLDDLERIAKSELEIQ